MGKVDVLMLDLSLIIFLLLSHEKSQINSLSVQLGLRIIHSVTDVQSFPADAEGTSGQGPESSKLFWSFKQTLNICFII